MIDPVAPDDSGGSGAGVPSSAATRVLIADDDPGVAGMLRRVLANEGFQVETAANAAEVLARLDERVPDVVLLDVVLGDDDGYEVLAAIRAGYEVPVIMVTGRGDEPDRVLGLRMGADDYVVKPFSYPELVARIGSVMRRTSARPGSAERSFGRLRIDPVAREVHLSGALVETTAKEFDLLAFLSARPRQVFTRDELLEQVWSSSSAWQDPATVTEHVRRLRLKIEEDPENPAVIVTVRGVGYRFES